MFSAYRSPRLGVSSLVTNLEMGSLRVLLDPQSEEHNWLRSVFVLVFWEGKVPQLFFCVYVSQHFIMSFLFSVEI